MITESVVNLFFSILTIAGQGLIIISIISAFIFRKDKSKNIIREFMKANGLLFAFVIALSATTGSLLYSNILNFEPCTLCWYQRIFMFPQAIILGIALLKKDKNIIDYSLVLSAIGILFSIYHYFIQTTQISGLPCSANAAEGGCSTQLVLEFGYISIPIMTMTVFALIILSLLYTREK